MGNFVLHPSQHEEKTFLRSFLCFYPFHWGDFVKIMWLKVGSSEKRKIGGVAGFPTGVENMRGGSLKFDGRRA